MKKISKIIILCMIIFTVSCANKLENNFNKKRNVELYSLIKKEIINENATHLKECNCMKAFYRNLLDKPKNTSRYIFDEKVGEHALEVSINKKEVNVLSIGSGTLLNELTAFANILARGKNLNIYLLDNAYVFYGNKNFKESALKYRKNKDSIPGKWKSFYFWNNYEDDEKGYLNFFEEHNTAIDEFKKVIKKLDKFYGTNTKITILQPIKYESLYLPKIDMVISIDAFFDLPSIIWEFFYYIKFKNEKIRYISLNKTKKLGGFWNAKKLEEKESISLNPVYIDVYDIIQKNKFGSYQLVERIKMKATEEQIKKGFHFPKDKDVDSSQGIFDMIE